MLAMSDYVVSEMHDELGTRGYKHACCWLSICIIIIKESRGSLCRSCYKLNSPNLTEEWGLGCVEGWGGDEEARGTYGCFIAEMDTHVLRVDHGIWVGKIVFFIFRICVNKYIYILPIFNNISRLKIFFH